ncbi:hypothetical protein NDU88_006488 [Pleurodeles waltl]|uniref:Secreted protein n=1 Tax=Pleurodeles waltl TaxID=8319 RepID=A0AAV7UMW9_PLEWA|nr:hypothetical protein NDU88_006488 [Pleurodeles waltl]
MLHAHIGCLCLVLIGGRGLGAVAAKALNWRQEDDGSRRRCCVIQAVTDNQVNKVPESPAHQIGRGLSPSPQAPDDLTVNTVSRVSD